MCGVKKQYRITKIDCSLTNTEQRTTNTEQRITRIEQLTTNNEIMSKIRKRVYDFLRGSFLTDDSAFRNWRIIIFVVVLLLVMIASSHKADKKVIQISKLNKEKRELRAEYVDTGTILMRMKMESNVKKKAKERGLKSLQSPPKKIKITIKD